MTDALKINKVAQTIDAINGFTMAVGGKEVYHPDNKPSAADLNAVNKAGDTMAGNLTAPKVLVSAAQGTEDNALTRKDYVDGKFAAVTAPTAILPMVIDANKAISIKPAAKDTAGSMSAADKSKLDSMQGFAVSGKSDKLKGPINFDSIESSGFYNLYLAKAAGSVNPPPFDYGTMIVVGADKDANTFVTQIATDQRTGISYTRTRNDGAMSWTGWRKSLDAGVGYAIRTMDRIGYQTDAKPMLILFAPKYVGKALPKRGFVGRITFERGATTATLQSNYIDISAVSAYTAQDVQIHYASAYANAKLVYHTHTDGVEYIGMYRNAVSGASVYVDGYQYGEEPIFISDATGLTVTNIETRERIYSAGNKPTNDDLNLVSRDGDVMTGALEMKVPDTMGHGKYSIKLNNGSIGGINQLVFNDPSDTMTEGILFPKTGKNDQATTSADYDTLWAIDGALKFNGQQAYGEWNKPDANDVQALPDIRTNLSVDLNTIGTIGVYYQVANASAKTALHYPLESAGSLIVTRSAYGVQQEYTTFGGRKYQRGLTTAWNGKDGPWGAWTEFYSEAGPSKFVDKTGDTMTGNLTFENDRLLQWVRNTDFAKIGFKNDADSDTDSYMWFETGDNGTEYFKFRVQPTTSPTLKVDLLDIKSNKADFHIPIVADQVKNAINVHGKGSISFQDGPNTRFHLWADGGAFKLSHGNDAQNPILNVLSDGAISSTGTFTAKDFLQSTAQTNLANASTRKDYVDAQVKGVEDRNVNKAGDTMTGILTAKDAQAGAVTFPTGASAVFTNGTGNAWYHINRPAGDNGLVISEGVTPLNQIANFSVGQIDLKRTTQISSGKLQIESAGNNILEFNTQGKHSRMIWMDGTTGDLNFCQSNGAYGESNRYMTLRSDGSGINLSGINWAKGSHAFVDQHARQAPFNVDFGTVNGGSDYYQIASGRTVVTGSGYTTDTEFGVLRSGGTWGTAVIRIGSGEVATKASQFAYTFDINGNFSAANVRITSDARLKSEFKPIENALYKVEQLTGKTYIKQGKDQREAGIIAQDLQKVLPESVGEFDHVDGNKYLSIESAGVNALLIEAIKELSEKVKQLEAKGK